MTFYSFSTKFSCKKQINCHRNKFNSKIITLNSAKLKAVKLHLTEITPKVTVINEIFTTKMTQNSKILKLNVTGSIPNSTIIAPNLATFTQHSTVVTPH